MPRYTRDFVSQRLFYLGTAGSIWTPTGGAAPWGYSVALRFVLAAAPAAVGWRLIYNTHAGWQMSYAPPAQT